MKISHFFGLGCLMAIFVGTATSAKDHKYVGVWEGNFDTPIYTKLVLKKDKSLTYCEVSSCRQVSCMDMKYTGSLENKFEYSDTFGKYEFTRISVEEFGGVFTHKEGDVSTAYYEPE